MKVLVASTAGEGHFAPLVPFAEACRDGGHEVLVTAPSSFASSVKRAGFDHAPFADVPPEKIQAVFGSLEGMSREESNAVVLREVFARLDAQAALPDLQALVDRWRPDLILRETAEFASLVVAEKNGIPHIEVAIGLLGFRDLVLRWVEGPLAELRSRVGVDRKSGQLYPEDTPVVTLLPESFDPVRARRPAVGRFRKVSAVQEATPLPDWWAGSTDPLVYVTFGSVAASLGLFPDLYRGAVGALAEVPARVLLTVGEAADPSLLDPLPANVHVERWYPQADVMPHASAIVGHGGFGTTLQALVSGIPMVVVPLFADQPWNAERVAEVGAGLMIEGGPAGMGTLAPALSRVLEEPAFRAEARRIAGEILALPPVKGALLIFESR